MHAKHSLAQPGRFQIPVLPVGHLWLRRIKGAAWYPIPPPPPIHQSPLGKGRRKLALASRETTHNIWMSREAHNLCCKRVWEVGGRTRLLPSSTHTPSPDFHPFCAKDAFRNLAGLEGPLANNATEPQGGGGCEKGVQNKLARKARTVCVCE